MDTSKNYVKMCERAMEIQEEWKKEVRVGDIFVHGPSSVQWSLVCEKITVVQVSAPPYFSYRIDHDIGGHWAFPNHETLTKGYFIWLPRQDQLQEVVANHVDSCQTILTNLYFEMTTYYGFLENGWKSFTSGEQLWLAFVMKKMYGKAWNGQDWVRKGYDYGLEEKS